VTRSHFQSFHYVERGGQSPLISNVKLEGIEQLSILSWLLESLIGHSTSGPPAWRSAGHEE